MANMSFLQKPIRSWILRPHVCSCRGHFGLMYLNIVCWFGCRDEVSYFYFLGKNIFYCLAHNFYSKDAYKQRAENIARAFAYIEDALGWENKTKIYPTQYENIIYIKPSKNWTSPCIWLPFTQNARTRTMTRSLFTAIIRDGEKYRVNDINEILHIVNSGGFQYLSDNGNAFKIFLDGNNFYIGKKCSGWCSSFCCSGSEQKLINKDTIPYLKRIQCLIPFWKVYITSE